MEDIKITLQSFGLLDYLTCGLFIVISLLVGFYYGFFSDTVSALKYFVNDRKLTTISVTVSLTASVATGLMILKIPADTYLHGIQHIYLTIGLLCMTVLMNYIYLPVLYNLNLISAYEYLERRFNKRIRIFVSSLFIISTIMWLPTLMYPPALVFSQITNVDVGVIIPLLCIICIFYTALGGIKAIICTDLIQIILMFGTVILIGLKGNFDVRNSDVIFNNITTHIESPKLDIDTAGVNLWSSSIGGCIYFLHTFALNQNILQKYFSLPSFNSVKRASWCFTLTLCSIFTLFTYCGILIYSYFYQCDPLTTKLARTKDELLPLFIMKIFDGYPGIVGLFVTEIWTASMSSWATALNSMTAVTFEDFYPLFFTKQLRESQSGLLMKLTTLTLGVIIIGLIYIIDDFNISLQLSNTIVSISSGPSLGLFTMGMLVPWINAKGALIGGMVSVFVTAWLNFKTVADDLFIPIKPLSTKGCRYHFTPKQTFNHYESLSTISYLWYPLIGTLVSIIVALSTNLLFEPSDPRDVDPRLLSPVIKKIIQPREFPNEPCDGIIYAFVPADKKNVTPLNSSSQAK